MGLMGSPWRTPLEMSNVSVSVPLTRTFPLLFAQMLNINEMNESGGSLVFLGWLSGICDSSYQKLWQSLEEPHSHFRQIL